MKHSSRGFIVPLIIAIIAIVAIGGAVIHHHKVASEAAATTNATTTAMASTSDSSDMTDMDMSATVSGSTSMSLADLMSASTAQVCTVSFDPNATTHIEGTVYVAGGKVHGDYSAKTSGQTFTTHFIAMDGNAYTWIDGMGTGFKTALNASAQTSASSQGAPDVSQKMNTMCKPWTADSSKFTLPVGINFSAAVSGAANLHY